MVSADTLQQGWSVTDVIETKHNYKIHDKKMLGVIHCLEAWRHFLEEVRCQRLTLLLESGLSQLLKKLFQGLEKELDGVLA